MRTALEFFIKCKKRLPSVRKPKKPVFDLQQH